MLALNSPESGWTEEDGDREELAKQASNILQRNSIMLKEYFSLHFTETGNKRKNYQRIIIMIYSNISTIFP